MSATSAPLDDFLAAGLPIRDGVVEPTSLAGLQAALRLAEASDLRVLWTGSQSQVRAWSNPDDFDIRLSVRGLDRSPRIDGAEGIVVAPAGMSWRDLQAQVAAAGHHLSPTLSPTSKSTVGGVIAAGFSGADRDRLGALRHQVLYTKVLLADGRVAPFGAPLVKNVTGFALHKLMVGQRGSLAGLLEVGLRITPLPKASRVWTAPFESFPTNWQRLRTAQWTGISVRVSSHPNPAFHWVAQGTQGAMADLEAAVRRETGMLPTAAEDLQEPWDERWSIQPDPWTCVIQSSPGDFAQIWGSLHQEGVRWAGVCDWLAMPAIAEFRGRAATRPSDGVRAALAANLAELPCRWRFLGASETKPLIGGPRRPETLQAAQEAVRREFDPRGRFQPRPRASQPWQEPNAG